MNKLQTQVHEYLKSKYQKATGKDMLCQKTLSPTRSKYYFENLEDNLYEKMSDRTRGFFEAGSVEELKDKMFALRSSSAMTFNLLGNDSITVKPNNFLGAGEYKIEYEKRLDTLQKNKTPANLDAFLEKTDELYFLPEEETEANFCTLESIKTTDEDFTVILAIENEWTGERYKKTYHVKEGSEIEMNMLLPNLACFLPPTHIPVLAKITALSSDGITLKAIGVPEEYAAKQDEKGAKL